VVLLHDDYSPPSGVYYFRQSAFSQYNGRRLVQATRGDVDRDVLRRFPARAVDVPGAPTLSHGRAPLETSMALLIDHVRPFALDSPVRVRPMKNPNPLRFQRAFEVLSHVQTLPYSELIGRRPGDEEWSSEQWDHYTEAPSDRRYAELAEELMERLLPEYRSDSLAQTLAIKSYLDENGIYSRRSRHAGADDPAASFLFGDLTGYCVHFAHAATYLFRKRGLPARVAAGYAVAESSRGTSSAIMIRGADAHAWPEVYLDGVGWVVVDLSPEQTLDEPTGAADPDLQRMLGEMMRQQWRDEEFVEEPPPMSLAEIGGWILRVLLALVALAYAVKLYRAQAPRFAGGRELYRVGYRAALDRLADAGWRRRFGESRERFAERTLAVSPAFAALTEEHLRGALGGRRRANAAGLRLLSGEVGRELRQRVPAWRRLLGLVNPLTWMMAR
jgi:transglutaminase-like putative cysteine protease